MSRRADILKRVKNALSLPALWLGDTSHDGQGHGNSSVLTQMSHSTGQPREWLPVVGNSFQERIQLFEKNTQALKAGFYHCSGREEAHEILKQIGSREGWKKVASHRGELISPAAEALGIPILWTNDGYDIAELEVCDVGITGCDALIAQTGSVLVTACSAGGRAISVLPPHHVVIAREMDLLPDLPAAFELLEFRYGKSREGYPSFISFITGPSRTGDIERILVLGAHGPKELTILLVP